MPATRKYKAVTAIEEQLIQAGILSGVIQLDPVDPPEEEARVWAALRDLEKASPNLGTLAAVYRLLAAVLANKSPNTYEGLPMASRRIDQFKVRNGNRVAYFADYGAATKWLREEFPERASNGFVVMETYDHPQYGRVATLVFAA